MAPRARAETPPPTAEAITQALLGIDNIVEVRAAEDQVYVIRRGVCVFSELATVSMPSSAS
jgi:hypothetical protein